MLWFFITEDAEKYGFDDFNTSNVMVLQSNKFIKSLAKGYFNTSNVMVLQSIFKNYSNTKINFNTSNVMVLP